MSAARNVRSRVARLERDRLRRGGAGCRVCDGGGYPGTFVQTDGAEPRQVGSWSCAGCGRVRVGAVVVLDNPSEWMDTAGGER